MSRASKVVGYMIFDKNNFPLRDTSGNPVLYTKREDAEVFKVLLDCAKVEPVFRGLVPTKAQKEMVSKKKHEEK